jgi:steroid delta-isomerase-like uncharacterized protein
MIKILLIASLFLLPLNSCDDKGTNIQKEEMNKNTVINFVSSIWNEKDLSQLDQFFSQEFKRRVNNVEIASNKEELTANIQVYLTGFPDLNLLIDDILPYHDQVIMNWTITGTNTGVFGEFPATGKKIKVSGLSHLSFDENGKISYEDIFYNELSLLQQLGYSLTPPALN